MIYLALACAADFMATVYCLHFGATEANPLVVLILATLGVEGWLVLKLGTVLVAAMATRRLVGVARLLTAIAAINTAQLVWALSASRRLW